MFRIRICYRPAKYKGAQLMYEEIKNKKDIVMDLSDTETTAKICRALSSETRLEILKCLVAKSMTISELAEAFYLPMSSMCLHI